MKYYDIDTVFTFGKYEGMSVKEVVSIQPSYIGWCAVNLDHFYIDNSEIANLREISPGFSLSEEAVNKLQEKYELWMEESEEDNDNDYYDYPDYNDYERDTFDALTDGQYGSYDDWRENGGDIDGLMDGLGF